MKKRIVTIALVVALLATCFAGTYAYLTDTDEATNVMVLGGVEIEQIEQERGENGLQKFTQNKPVYPAVYPGSSIPWASEDDWVTPGDAAWKVVEDNVNVVDKFVTVENTGDVDAWVRTIVAFEVGPEAVNDPYMHLVCNGNNADTVWTYEWLQENGKQMLVQLGDTYYAIAVFTYNAVLGTDETTTPSIKQIYLDKSATNEVIAKYGKTFEILALSQAVQASGWDNATAALNEAFGEVTSANVATWMNDLDAAEPTNA